MSAEKDCYTCEYYEEVYDEELNEEWFICGCKGELPEGCPNKEVSECI